MNKILFLLNQIILLDFLLYLFLLLSYIIEIYILSYNYHILLIISDGEIFDIDETIDSIIEASKFPISFIIIGIGANVSDDMKILNGEKGKLISSKGEVLNKDIVQYVHFNDYADDLTKLTQAVLKYRNSRIRTPP